jgi:hypothetical protein
VGPLLHPHGDTVKAPRPRLTPRARLVTASRGLDPSATSPNLRNPCRSRLRQGERGDSNPRPPGPQPGSAALCRALLCGEPSLWARFGCRLVLGLRLNSGVPVAPLLPQALARRHGASDDDLSPVVRAATTRSRRPVASPKLPGVSTAGTEGTLRAGSPLSKLGWGHEISPNPTAPISATPSSLRAGEDEHAKRASSC